MISITITSYFRDAKIGGMILKIKKQIISDFGERYLMLTQ